MVRVRLEANLGADFIFGDERAVHPLLAVDLFLALDTHHTQRKATRNIVRYLGQPGFFDVVVGVADDDGEAEEEDVSLRVGQRSYPLIRLLACI